MKKRIHDIFYKLFGCWHNWKKNNETWTSVVCTKCEKEKVVIGHYGSVSGRLVDLWGEEDPCNCQRCQDPNRPRI